MTDIFWSELHYPSEKSDRYISEYNCPYISGKMLEDYWRRSSQKIKPPGTKLVESPNLFVHQVVPWLCRILQYFKLYNIELSNWAKPAQNAFLPPLPETCLIYGQITTDLQLGKVCPETYLIHKNLNIWFTRLKLKVDVHTAYRHHSYFHGYCGILLVYNRDF